MMGGEGSFFNLKFEMKSLKEFCVPFLNCLWGKEALSTILCFDG